MKSGNRKLEVVGREEVGALLGGPDVPSGADLDEMAVPTYMHANPLARWIFWRRHRTILDLAELGPQDAVLDFGTGVGALLPSLCALAGTIWATDLRDGLARTLVARRGLNVWFFASGQLAESIPDGSLNVVIAADVLEHIAEPRLSEILRLFGRKLAVGGRLVISLPTENLLYRIGRIAAGYVGKGDYHRTGIRSFLDSAFRVGYRVSRKRSLPLPGPACLFSIMRLEPIDH